MEQLVEMNLSRLEFEFATLPIEEREVPRTPAYETHCLTITSEQDFLVGLLVDYSPKGLGAETFGPLAVSTMVSVVGTVKVDGTWKKYSGVARVVHCRANIEGRYRLGLAFETSTWVDTAAPNSETIS